MTRSPFRVPDPPPTPGGVVEVAPSTGETLSGIAAFLADPNVIHPGQVLRIPAGF